eukprot:CAMPEP_0184321288 /NCGR_PEP_ID=MMETSP1049-20130417/118125_1 /TAXON_ID=77928 /ORGANISM="Proteomonas sulcata, Strain CCMP704" /LENGTH=49 /DNA_ID= /DNA_START= /DNA_END= /DNA_ORIENTATION=
MKLFVVRGDRRGEDALMFPREVAGDFSIVRLVEGKLSAVPFVLCCASSS